MSNASPASARAGYQLFLLSGFSLKHDELSDQLQQAGFGPVSDRMWKHYNALANAGYDHYVTINRFDIARAARPFEDETASNRYAYLEADVPVQITVIRDDAPVAAQLRTERVGEAGVILVTEEADAVAALKKLRLKAGEYVRLDFLDPVGVAHGRATGDAEVSEDPPRALLEIEFGRLRSVEDLAGVSALPTSPMLIRLHASDGGAIEADVLGRRLFYLLEGVEIARSMVNEIIATEAVDRNLHAHPLQVSRVNMDSPLEVLYILPPAVAAVAGGIWFLVHSITGEAQRAQNVRLTGAQVRKAIAEARTIELGNEAIEERNLTERVLHERVREALQESGVELDASSGQLTARFESLAGKQAIDAFSALAQQEVDDVVIEAGDDASPEAS